MKGWQRFVETFEEPNGGLSFSRVSSAIVLAAWLTWVTFIVFSTKALPDHMWEISTVVGVLYSLNKAAEAVTTIATTQAATTSSSSSVITQTEKSTSPPPDVSESPLH